MTINVLGLKLVKLFFQPVKGCVQAGGLGVFLFYTSTVPDRLKQFIQYQKIEF